MYALCNTEPTLYNLHYIYASAIQVLSYCKSPIINGLPPLCLVGFSPRGLIRQSDRITIKDAQGRYASARMGRNVRQRLSAVKYEL